MKDRSNEEDRTAGARRYAFGDTEAAAARLAVVAEVFEEPIASLLNALDLGPIDLAVDLGCGPGHTTKLLAEIVNPKQLAGLDLSAPFLQRARALGLPTAGWYCHDVTVVPFPTGPADFLHCRWVLAHLANPEEILLRWLGQLRPGGYLVIDEDEEIIADHPVLAAYDRMSGALVAHRGGDLVVGRRLKDVEPPPGYCWELNRLYRHVVAGHTAARIFAMNFAVWRNDPWVLDSYGRGVLEEMAAELKTLGVSQEAGQVTFVSRQLVYRAHDAGLSGVPA